MGLLFGSGKLIEQDRGKHDHADHQKYTQHSADQNGQRLRPGI